MNSKLFTFLDTMQLNKRYQIKPEHIPVIEQWMNGKDYDGGISFSSDWSEIYKCEMPKEKTK